MSSIEKTIEKMRGRTIDAVFCEKCNIYKGIYPLSLIPESKNCPYCGNPLTMNTMICITFSKAER